MRPRLESAAPHHSMPPSRDSRREHRETARKASHASHCKGAAAAPARGFAPLALPAGYLNKEIVSCLRSARRIVLFCPHGTGGDADDRQGNGACRGDAAGLFFKRDDAELGWLSSGASLPLRRFLRTMHDRGRWENRHCERNATYRLVLGLLFQLAPGLDRPDFDASLSSFNRLITRRNGYIKSYYLHVLRQVLLIVPGGVDNTMLPVMLINLILGFSNRVQDFSQRLSDELPQFHPFLPPFAN